VQFDVTDYAAVLSDDGIVPLDYKNISLEYMLESQITIQPGTLSSAIFQYTTAVSHIQKDSLADLALVASTNNARKNFYFIRRNGFGPIRAATTSASNQFKEHFHWLIEHHDKQYLTIMIVCLAVLVFSLVILIPVTNLVYKTNDRAMSLFGYLSLKDIDSMAEKCEEFLENYLQDIKYAESGAHEYYEDDDEDEEEEDEDSDNEGEVKPKVPKIRGSKRDASKKDTSKISLPSHNSLNNIKNNIPSQKIIKSFNSIKGGSTKGRVTLKLNTNDLKVREQEKSMNEPGNLDESIKPLQKGKLATIIFAKKIARKLSDLEKKRRHQAALAEAEEQFQAMRTQKLLDSRSVAQKVIILKCTLLNAIFVGYYIGDFIHEHGFLNDISHVVDFMDTASRRICQIKYLMGFTNEEISEVNLDNVYKYTGKFILIIDQISRNGLYRFERLLPRTIGRHRKAIEDDITRGLFF